MGFFLILKRYSEGANLPRDLHRGTVMLHQSNRSKIFLVCYLRIVASLNMLWSHGVNKRRENCAENTESAGGKENKSAMQILE